MSKTIARLRRKINSSRDLRSVVRTMKAVAASSIGQYESSVLALADYSRSVELGLSVCLRNSTPLVLNTRLSMIAQNVSGSLSPVVTDAVVFGSDQGLVGRFNDVVSEFAVRALSELPGEFRIYAVGERVRDRLIASGLPVAVVFEFPLSVQGIASLVGEILITTDAGRSIKKDAALHLYYNCPQANGGYSPVRHRLLPLDQEWLMRIDDLTWPSARYSQVLGDNRATLSSLINEYLFVSVFRSCAESLASENLSRLAAMQRADRNIDSLLKELTNAFHDLRKARIDEELFDVVAAFDSY